LADFVVQLQQLLTAKVAKKDRKGREQVCSLTAIGLVFLRALCEPLAIFAVKNFVLPLSATDL
jgi:hypothetical protein